MQDTITTILNQYDLTGKYLDDIAINKINNYFRVTEKSLLAIELINSLAPKIVKETAAKLYSEQPELLRPGGNSYTTRRYATCLRDIDYYLRYTSYALIAGNTDILNERLLNGLRETYLSLNVPLGPTTRSIQILKEVVINNVQSRTNINIGIITELFDYITINLSEQNI
uniref:Allophycocyanin beta 18 subunit n=1 Tax=Cliftonaea pectinata TaxID=2007206 RepID=A0A1Z1MPR4_9FLOR|nr:allophycocyanin beta 18 subunit [Cliftonaea pectinata]ARW68083.1 allophycocyanin beta 18 subunit [Cliftonaea pectinata]